MDRRSCIKAGMFVTATLALGKANFGLASPSVSALEKGGIRELLGLELYTVHQLMAKDFEGTIEAVAKIGYSEVEIIGFGAPIFVKDPLYGYSPRAFKEFFNNQGLQIPTAHFFTDRVEDLGSIADTANEVGVDYLILGMAPEFISMTPEGPRISRIQDLEQVKRIVDRFNTYGETLKKYGMRFAYHNHHMEFDLLGKQPAFDYIIANTDPELVKIQLDVGWTEAAGINASKYISRNADRIISCHMKDYDPTKAPGDPSTAPIPEVTQMVTPGDGTIDFAAVMSAMDRSAIKHAFVEVDFSGEPMDSAQRGYHYLKKLARPA